jgi:plasmid stabilization system protein ParE
MSRRVVLSRSAAADLAEAYRRAAASAPLAAARWFNRFEAALATLSHNPERCPVARESRNVRFAVRELLFGKRPHVFRVVFMINDGTVRVLRILRAQRRFLTLEQIEAAAEEE